MTMIQSDASLAELCRHLKECPSFGIDMEFQRDRTYFPRLYLVQVASPGPEEPEIALVDPMRAQNLKPLFELVADPDIETILHAGRQDMEIVYQLTGLIPHRIFDTQIGAALIGYGDQPGYGTLVDRIAGVQLAKLETITDWSRRPLTSGQMSYAEDDVRYLHELRLHIGGRLEELGRVEWAREEMAHYEEEGTYDRDLSRLYLKIGRTRNLNRRGLAILRELAVWREREAMERDEPRGRVVSDELLVEIARRAPMKPGDLHVLRGLHPQEIKRTGAAIVAAVAKATALPEAEWPEPWVPRPEESELSLTVDLLEVFLRSRALEADIAPSYLGSRADIADLALHIRGEAAQGGEPPLLLSGWRKGLVGDDLVAIASGRINLHVDPGTGRVTTSSR